MRLFKSLMIAILVVGTMDSCIKEHNNPKKAAFNSRGCIECDRYEVGEKFSIGGVNYTVADRGMLESAIENGADLTKFCTSKVTNMSRMFYSSQAFFNDLHYFNQNISNWDVSNVTDMSSMFSGAQAFNQNIGDWDVSKVTDMSLMFSGARAFNQNIGDWDVSNVTNMLAMFYDAQAFNRDLSRWCVKNIPSKPGSFAYLSSLTNENYPVWGTCP